MSWSPSAASSPKVWCSQSDSTRSTSSGRSRFQQTPAPGHHTLALVVPADLGDGHNYAHCAWSTGVRRRGGGDEKGESHLWKSTSFCTKISLQSGLCSSSPWFQKQLQIYSLLRLCSPETGLNICNSFSKFQTPVDSKLSKDSYSSIIFMKHNTSPVRE